MGKLEKVIVLSVLFVIAVILVVSLTTDNPIDKKNVSVLGQPGAGPAAPRTSAAPTDVAALPATSTNAAAVPAAGGAAPSPLLSSNVNTSLGTTPLTAVPAANVAAPNVLPQGSILMTSEGLSDSYLPDMKFYTWQSGDTFRGVANTYYGDWQKLALLRRANEGRKDVQPGEKILVPVYDLDAPAGGPALAGQSNPAAANVAASPIVASNARTPGTAPVTPKTNAKSTTKPAPKASVKSADAAKVASSSAAKVHVVKEGESLWKIASLELGNGKLWDKIYAANKDVMSSPEALKTGMKLKIP